MLKKKKLIEKWIEKKTTTSTAPINKDEQKNCYEYNVVIEFKHEYSEQNVHLNNI